jgi:hypothetical protein
MQLKQKTQYITNINHQFTITARTKPFPSRKQYTIKTNYLIYKDYDIISLYKGDSYIVRSSADSKNHCNEISMQSEQGLLHILAEAEEDVSNMRVAPIQQTFNDIRNSLLNIIEQERM